MKQRIKHIVMSTLNGVLTISKRFFFAPGEKNLIIFMDKNSPTNSKALEKIITKTVNEEIVYSK